ncbi:MAG: L-threonylcarbamoyladenylate synthase [Desulfomonilaceae bacterium]
MAAKAVRCGGTAIIGTETFYAIAANPFIDEAVKKVFSIKNRSFENPLPLIAANRKFVNSRVRVLPHIATILIENFWPGSLTILLNTDEDFSKLVQNVSGKIGVRVPPQCPARQLAEEVGGWITATSANLSGDSAPKSIMDIPPEIIHSVDVVVDSGPCSGGLPSTVVDISKNGFKIVRIGAVSEKSLLKSLEHGD